MKRLAWLATLPLLILPLAALAADGYTTGNVNLRAGPDTSYPMLDTIPAGAPVGIQGCTSGWEWCDVAFQGERGWVAGNFIQYEYDNRNVLVPQYGARIGIPIVTFVIQTYWNSYYRNRPFYRERQRWYSRPVPHRPPPRPAHRPAPPHHGATPPHRPMQPARPARPLPDRHARPMPQRPATPSRPQPHRPPANAQRPPQHAAPHPQGNARPSRPAPAAGHGAPASHSKPAAHGKSSSHDKDQHGH